MNWIEQLLDKLCPNGVQFLPVADLFDIKNGYTPSKNNSSFWNNGTIPWFRMEDIRANGRVLNSALQMIPDSAVKGGRLFPANSILVSTSATIGEHALVTVPHLSNQRFTSLAIKDKFKHLFEIKFLFYYTYVLAQWCKENTTMSSFAGVEMAGFKKFKFPMPPLEVQKEIVRILDTFTELEAELEAELDARKKQYEHYRSSLLSFSEQGAVRWVPLAEIADLNWGDTSKTKSSYVTEGFLAFSAAGGDGLLSTYDYDRPGIVLSAIGALAGKTWRARGKWSCIKNTIRIFSLDESVVLTDYLYWFTSTSNFWPRRGSAQPFISKGDADKVIVAVPDIEEQKRIVNILDAFEDITFGLDNGLPAEIEARRKQHEYYRDRLLAFKELEA